MIDPAVLGRLRAGMAGARSLLVEFLASDVVAACDAAGMDSVTRVLRHGALAAVPTRGSDPKGNPARRVWLHQDQARHLLDRLEARRRGDV